MIPESELMALKAVILRMEETVPLTKVQLFHMAKRRKFRRMRPNEDTDEYREEVARNRKKWPIKNTFHPRNKSHPVYGDTHYALGFHVQSLNDELDNWFTVGADSPPHVPEGRIKVILKRAKDMELRNRFVTAYDKHFANFWKPPINREPSGDKMRDSLQGKIPRLEISVRDIEDRGDGKFAYGFEFHCCDCGGWMLDLPDDDDGPVICVACEQVFGSFADMKALASHIGNEKAKSLGLL
ncbi:MAG: hypothetical protein P1U75_20210 [Antarcticimicrobium sp.]|uniref:hypothetical protein n=1 Tax=Antarcticimicrobium sp. TaxID=2824147 RepID=UPI00260DD2E0|nr:hypothetical protein [Antarcticimicrobium sp.]MDF1718965.1 hypothetical protein [Antarcticimicrobium sp.]